MSTSYLLTPTQTVGPFYAPCLLREDARRNVLVQPETLGERIRITGHILEGGGLPATEVLVETWQANAQGRYNHVADQGPATLDPTFLGFGRTQTDDDGMYWFETIKPGAVPFNDKQMQAPHINLTIMARGLLNHLVTRLYFADESANSVDPVLQLVPEQRRMTLLAHPAATTEDTIPTYRFDIVLQGPDETVFFNF
jgi:protocatechuate 3,4-dioxygenase alpha subunit